MTFETNHVIANVTLGDWLKSRSSFSSKTKTNRTLNARFSPRFEQITGNFSEF